MNEIPYKLILLEVDRSFLSGTSEQEQKFQTALVNLKEKGAMICLVLPYKGDEMGNVRVLGYLNSTFISYRRCLVATMLQDLALCGFSVGGPDVIYFADKEDGRKGANDFCRFENIDPGIEALNAKLAEIFGEGIFAKACTVQKDTPKAAVDSVDKLVTKPVTEQPKREVQPNVSDLPKPPKFAERYPKTARVLKAMRLMC